MQFSQVLQRKETWQFDLTSALIGAALAWLIVGIIFSYRHQILSFFHKIWAPIDTWRRKTRAGQGEKYLKALQDAVKAQLLFQPENPELIFIPPIFHAPPPLPKSLAEAAETPAFIEVPFKMLLDGASRVVITGSLGSGRTTALLMTIWETTNRADDDEPYDKIPVWINLQHIAQLTENKKDTPLDRFLQLSALTLPHVSPKWLQQQLRNTPSVILLDNWDKLPNDERGFVAAWIAEIAQILPDSYWIATSDKKGYGLLTEIGFVPVELHHAWTEIDLKALVQGWSNTLAVDFSSDGEEITKGLQWALKAGATPLELVLRAVLYLQTKQFPRKPTDTLDFHLELAIPTPDLGDELEDLGNQARMIALNITTQVAMIRRLQNRWLSRQELAEIIKENLPPKEERHRKLESTVRKIVNGTRLLHDDNKTIKLPHYVWVDFLTAWYLAHQESGLDYIQSHLDDPYWTLLIDFYVGLVEKSEPLIDILLGKATIYNDYATILRASRWALVAPDTCAWRDEVIKTLAKSFIDSATESDIRLIYGRYLGIVAGESARPFFIKMLSSSNLDVRSASLRGLGWTGSPKEMAILAAALNDSTLEIQRSAILGLRDMGTPGATTLLGEYLVNADEELAPLVAQALAGMPDGPGILQDAVRHPDLLVRRAAVHGLGQIHDPWAYELLEEIIRTDAEWLVRSAAETSVTSQQEEVAETNLIQPQPKIDEVEWLIRWAARQGAGLGVGAAALAMLIRAIQEGDANTKVLGVLTLNQIGRQEHLSVLQPLLHNTDELVKAQANEVIQNITHRYQVYENS